MAITTENDYLFMDHSDNRILDEDVVNALKSIGAHDCDVLLVHSELSFGVPNPMLKRKEILHRLLGIFQGLGVGTLLFPTFTFSFSNYEDYSILSSRSRMGALTEYARKQPGAIRSIDPQMSFAALGDNHSLVQGIGKECIGEESTFDKMHNQDGTRILFFGTSVDKCFTHQHYVERMLNVPYRYNLDFTGNIIDADGKTHEDTYTVFVKYRDVIPYTPPAFEAEMIEDGIMLDAKLGDSVMTCFTEKDAFNETAARIKENVNAFLAEPYDTKPLVKEYSYGDVTTVQ